MPSSPKEAAATASSPKDVGAIDSSPKEAAATTPSPTPGSPEATSPNQGSSTAATPAGILPAQHWIQAAEVCEPLLIRDCLCPDQTKLKLV